MTTLLAMCCVCSWIFGLVSSMWLEIISLSGVVVKIKKENQCLIPTG